ncbi:MAG: hypothetical protein ABFD89_01010 [Bryobacteraceae bacterium]
MEFPLIEMGEQYREVETKRAGRVLCVDGKFPGYPVDWERSLGAVVFLTADGKTAAGADVPFIERVAKTFAVRVNVYRCSDNYILASSDGGQSKSFREALNCRLIASKEIEFTEGEGLEPAAG